MSKSKWFQKLTPKGAWDHYVYMSVKHFVSLFYSDGITDVRKMCRRFAKDIPWNEDSLFTQGQLDHIAELLEHYINEEGYEPDELYTEEELEEIFQGDADFILDALGLNKRN